MLESVRWATCLVRSISSFYEYCTHLRDGTSDYVFDLIGRRNRTKRLTLFSLCVPIQFWWNWILIQYSLSNRSGNRDVESFHSCTPDSVILPYALRGLIYAVLGKLILGQWTIQEWRSHHRSIPESPCVGYTWRLLFFVLYMVRSAKLPLILSAT